MLIPMMTYAPEPAHADPLQAVRRAVGRHFLWLRIEYDQCQLAFLDGLVFAQTVPGGLKAFITPMAEALGLPDEKAAELLRGVGFQHPLVVSTAQPGLDHLSVCIEQMSESLSCHGRKVGTVVLDEPTGAIPGLARSLQELWPAYRVTSLAELDILSPDQIPDEDDLELIEGDLNLATDLPFDVHTAPGPNGWTEPTELKPPVKIDSSNNGTLIPAYLSGLDDEPLNGHAADEPHAGPVEETPEDVPAAPPTTQPRILIAEEDTIVANLLRFLLEREGYEALVVTDTREAYRVLSQMTPPSLILLDFALPFPNGIQLIAYIRSRQEWKDVPVLLLAADFQGQEIVRALNAGADDYVVKPFLPEELLIRLRRLLRTPARH
jgi:CheY-like chemotaxis protein